MTELLGRLTALGDSLAAWLLPALLWSALLFVLVRAADELLARRVSASWRVALYAVIVLRLALPAGWETPLGVLPGQAAPAPLELPATEIVNWSTAPASSVAAAEPVAAPAPRVAWTAALPVAQALGALALLAWMLLSRRRLEAELAGAVPARDELAALAPRQRVLEHEAVGPAVAGVLRPRIVVPRALVDLLDRASLSAVLRHEAAHCERRDPLLQAGVQLVLALLWPVLPLWLAAHRVRQLVEQACDERALAGEEALERKRYGETLLAVAAAGPARVRPALGLLRFGAALRSRLKALRFARRWPGFVQGGLTLLALLAVIGTAGTRPAAAPSSGEAVAGSASRPAQAEWRVLREGEWLGAGDRVRVERGLARIEFVESGEVQTLRDGVVLHVTASARVTRVQGSVSRTLPLPGLAAPLEPDLRVAVDWDQLPLREGLQRMADRAGLELVMDPALDPDHPWSVSAEDKSWSTLAWSLLDSGQLHGRIEGRRLVVERARPPRVEERWSQLPAALARQYDAALSSITGKAHGSWGQGHPKWDGEWFSLVVTYTDERDLDAIRAAFEAQSCAVLDAAPCFVAPRFDEEQKAPRLFTPAEGSAETLRLVAGWRSGPIVVAPVGTRVLDYEPPIELRTPDGVVEQVTGSRLAPAGSRLLVGEGRAVGSAEAGGPRTRIVGPTSILLRTEMLLSPGLPGGADNVVQGDSVILEAGSLTLRATAPDLELGPGVPPEVRGALQEAVRRAFRASDPKPGDGSFLAAEDATYALGLLRVRARISDELAYSRLLEALEEDPRFDDVAMGLTQEDVGGIDARFQARWVGTPGETVPAMPREASPASGSGRPNSRALEREVLKELLDLAGEHSLKPENVNVAGGSRTGGPDFWIGLNATAPSRSELERWEAAVRTRWPEAALRLGEIRDSAEGGVSFLAKVAWPGAEEPAERTRTTPSASGGSARVSPPVPEPSGSPADETAAAPATGRQVDAVARLDRLAKENGVEFTRLSPGRRTREGAYPLAVEGRTDARAALAAWQEAVRASWPGAELSFGEVQELESGSLSFAARLLWPPGEGTAPKAERAQPVMIEFRIVELSGEARLDAGDWRRDLGRDGAGDLLDTFALDLWIQEAEREGEARIVSMPRVMVQVGERAEIESGVRIPIVSTTAEEIDISFLEGSLRASAVPRRGPDGVSVEWTVDLAEPEVHLEGVAREGETDLGLVPVEGRGTQVAVWITPVPQPERGPVTMD